MLDMHCSVSRPTSKPDRPQNTYCIAQAVFYPVFLQNYRKGHSAWNRPYPFCSSTSSHYFRNRGFENHLNLSFFCCFYCGRLFLLLIFTAYCDLLPYTYYFMSEICRFYTAGIDSGHAFKGVFQLIRTSVEQ